MAGQTHSPLPYGVQRKAEHVCGADVITDANGVYVALLRNCVVAREYPCAVNLHDAEFIVRACNNYYPMLEALKALIFDNELYRAYADESGIGRDEWLRRAALINAARDAIQDAVATSHA